MPEKDKLFYHFDQAYNKIYCLIYDEKLPGTIERLPADLDPKIHNETFSVMRGRSNYPDDLSYAGVTKECVESIMDTYDLSEDEVRDKLDEYLDIAREKSVRFIEDINDRKDTFESNPAADDYGSLTP